MAGIVVGAGDTKVNKTQILTLMKGFDFLYSSSPIQDAGSCRDHVHPASHHDSEH